MISEQAKQGVDFIFTKAAAANLAMGPDDCCEITPLPDVSVVDFPEETIVVLTISSFLFRLLTIFHVNDDVVTREYFTKGAADKQLFEVLSEIGNLCCGAMNRELLHSFPHLGMSTRYVLNRQCLAFLDELKPGYVSGYAISINNTVQMHASLCLCEYAPIDFSVDMSSTEEETGALELF